MILWQSVRNDGKLSLKWWEKNLYTPSSLIMTLWKTHLIMTLWKTHFLTGSWAYSYLRLPCGTVWCLNSPRITIQTLLPSAFSQAQEMKEVGLQTGRQSLTHNFSLTSSIHTIFLCIWFVKKTHTQNNNLLFNHNQGLRALESTVSLINCKQPLTIVFQMTTKWTIQPWLFEEKVF